MVNKTKFVRKINPNFLLTTLFYSAFRYSAILHSVLRNKFHTFQNVKIFTTQITQISCVFNVSFCVHLHIHRPKFILHGLYCHRFSESLGLSIVQRSTHLLPNTMITEGMNLNSGFESTLKKVQEVTTNIQIHKWINSTDMNFEWYHLKKKNKIK